MHFAQRVSDLQSYFTSFQERRAQLEEIIAENRSETLENNKIKVHNIVSYFDNKAAGTSYSVSRIVKSTSILKYKATLLSASDLRIEDIDQDFIHPESVKLFKRNNFFGKFSQKLDLSFDMLNFLHKSRPDILHAHGLWTLPSFVGPLLASKKGIPFVISPHGMLGREALQFSKYKKKCMLALGQRKALHLATCIRATAFSEVEEIRRAGLRQPIALIPNGIDVPAALAKSDGKNYLLSLGRVHPKKGLGNLISAWATVAEAFPEWSLRIVGPDEGGHRAELLALTKNTGAPRVSLEDGVFGDEKWRLLSEAGVFVLPTLNENFANTVAESLAVGVPVISSKGAPWEGLVYNKCGWWVNADVPSLGEAIRKAIMVGPAHRRQMGALGRAWMIRDYQWAAIGARMNAVYDWMLDSSQITPDLIFD
jgi:glycosyltransferase involved in cell wall biosynthesis